MYLKAALITPLVNGDIEAFARAMLGESAWVYRYFDHTEITLLAATTLAQSTWTDAVDTALFCAPDKTGVVKPEFMLQREYWNGFNHQPTAWDGLIETAVELRADHVPQPSWHCIIFEYHW